jgi:hypothetical protein
MDNPEEYVDVPFLNGETLNHVHIYSFCSDDGQCISADNIHVRGGIIDWMEANNIHVRGGIITRVDAVELARVYTYDELPEEVIVEMTYPLQETVPGGAAPPPEEEEPTYREKLEDLIQCLRENRNSESTNDRLHEFLAYLEEVLTNRGNRTLPRGQFVHACASIQLETEDGEFGAIQYSSPSVCVDDPSGKTNCACEAHLPIGALANMVMSEAAVLQGQGVFEGWNILVGTLLVFEEPNSTDRTPFIKFMSRLKKIEHLEKHNVEYLSEREIYSNLGNVITDFIMLDRDSNRRPDRFDQELILSPECLSFTLAFTND